MSVLEIKNLNKSYRGANKVNSVLKNISLSVNKNEFVSIIGPSGCGKSSLLDTIAGLTSIDSGEIRLNSRLINGLTGKVSYLMQADLLLPWRTLKQNVALPLEIKNMAQIEIDKKVNSLTKVFGLSGYLDYYPRALSGGMRQRASIMRSYILSSEVILLDEPFSSLDALLKFHLENWFLDIWQKHMLSVLMVTHDIDSAIFLSDRILVMSSVSKNIFKEILIPFKRPRNNTLRVSAEFLKLKAQLLEIFKLLN